MSELVVWNSFIIYYWGCDKRIFLVRMGRFSYGLKIFIIHAEITIDIYSIKYQSYPKSRKIDAFKQELFFSSQTLSITKLLPLSKTCNYRIYFICLILISCQWVSFLSLKCLSRAFLWWLLFNLIKSLALVPRACRRKTFISIVKWKNKFHRKCDRKTKLLIIKSISFYFQLFPFKDELTRTISKNFASYLTV